MSTYYQRDKERLSEQDKEYYKNNKERLNEQAINKYRELSVEEKEKKKRIWKK